MQKIVIIGPCAAGKTTLAKQFGQILTIPTLHLDSIFWRPGWQPIPHAERRDLLQQFISQHPAWIVEGSYLSSTQPAMEAADTIIVLTAPIWMRAYRLVKRSLSPCSDDAPAGCFRGPTPRMLSNLFFSATWQRRLEDILTPHSEKLWRVQAKEVNIIVELLRGVKVAKEKPAANGRASG